MHRDARAKTSEKNWTVGLNSFLSKPINLWLVKAFFSYLKSNLFLGNKTMKSSIIKTKMGNFGLKFESG